jgi:hypothetical protein
MLQSRIVPSDTRLPLPAPVALDIMLAASTLRDSLTWSPASLPLLERFRACLAVCVNCTFLYRAETGSRCLTVDLGVNIPSQQIGMFLRKSKGDKRRDTRDTLVPAVPIPANPMLANLVTTTPGNVRLSVLPTTGALPLWPLGASHIWKPPPSGKLPQPFHLA